MWFNRKSRIQPGSPRTGHLPEYFIFNQRSYPLTCEVNHYSDCYALMKTLCESIFTRAVTLHLQVHPISLTCLAQELRNINILGITQPINLAALEKMLQDTEHQRSTLQFYCELMGIYQIVDTLALSVMEGRYYYHLLHTFRNVDEQTLTSAVKRIPWLWMLGPYQQAVQKYPMTLELLADHLQLPVRK